MIAQKHAHLSLSHSLSLSLFFSQKHNTLRHTHAHAHTFIYSHTKKRTHTHTHTPTDAHPLLYKDTDEKIMGSTGTMGVKAPHSSSPSLACACYSCLEQQGLFLGWSGEASQQTITIVNITPRFGWKTTGNLLHYVEIIMNKGFA